MVSNIDIFQGIVSKLEIPVSWQHYGKHNPSCHLQIPTKALSCKKEAVCEHGPEAPSCPVCHGSFKIDCFKVEKCSMVRRVQIWHSCWKLRIPCLWPSSVLSAFSSKPASLDCARVRLPDTFCISSWYNSRAAVWAADMWSRSTRGQ